MTRSGSVAAKGIAPSEIETQPIIKAAFPASFSSVLNLFLKSKVDNPQARGGIAQETPTAAIINNDDSLGKPVAGLILDNMAVPNP